ncbi:MAG: exosome complex RNA-binding protein Csl4 [Sulfolobales archaeon]
MSRLKELMNMDAVPGTALCVIEEFLPGSWVYEEEGVVRAAVVGKVSPDLRLRTISVKPCVKTPQLLSKGNIIYGLVTILYEELAVIKIFANELGRRYDNPFTGLLHITQVQEGYVRNFYDVLAVGDIVKAKVLNDTTPYSITIKEQKLGVVMAYCTICGSPMRKYQSDTLKCFKCGNIEKRKLSTSYAVIKV